MADRIDRISWTGWVLCSFLGAGGGLAAAQDRWVLVGVAAVAVLGVIAVANWLIHHDPRLRYDPDLWRVTVGADERKTP